MRHGEGAGLTAEQEVSRRSADDPEDAPDAPTDIPLAEKSRRTRPDPGEEVDGEEPVGTEVGSSGRPMLQRLTMFTAR